MARVFVTNHRGTQTKSQIQPKANVDYFQCSIEKRSLKVLKCNTVVLSRVKYFSSTIYGYELTSTNELKLDLDLEIDLTHYPISELSVVKQYTSTY